MPVVYLVVTAVALTTTVFALQNATEVTVKFLAWKIESAPLAAVILISVAAGALVVSLIGAVQRWKLRAQIRDLQSRLRTLEQPLKPER